MASRRPTDSPRIPTAESPSPAKTPPVRKPRAKKAAAPTVSAPIQISADVRREMIAEAAYLRAERRGFTGGHEQEREDWLTAEAEVDALLKGGHGSPAQ
jgi:Protein of unknown function (DUF2934)